VIEVDYSESEDKKVVLSTVAHQTSVLAADEVRDIVNSEATPLKHN